MTCIIQLVKSVTHRTLIYNFYIYCWLTFLVKNVEKQIKNFILYGYIKHRKLVIIVRISHPLNEGSLIIRSLKDINNVVIIKLACDLATSSQHWAILLRYRVFRMYGHIRYHIDSFIWRTLKVKLTAIYENNKWQLGKGKNINFWVNSWLDDSLLSIFNIDKDKKYHLYATVIHLGWSLESSFDFLTYLPSTRYPSHHDNLC